MEEKDKNQEGKSKETKDEVIEVNLMKEDYLNLGYDLPDFDKLAEDFDVEKAYEKESSFLLREIRRIMVEKLSAYLQLFETFLNPNSPPMFVFSALRTLNEEDKEFINDMYKNLSKYQLWSIKLDTIYKEEKEVEFIKKSFNDWQNYKPKIYSLIEKLENSKDEKTKVDNNGYFN